MKKIQPTADCIVARLVPSWGSIVSLLFKTTEPYTHYYDEHGEEVPYGAIASWTDVELPPEESEDERIRKHIIDIIKDNAKSKCIPCDAEIAYLEKQKEPKSIKDAAKEATKDKESAEKFLKTAGIVDENGNLAEIYRSEQEPTDVDNEEIELSDFESELFSAFSDGWQQYLHGEEVDMAQWAKEHSAQLLNAAKQELRSAEWSEEDGMISEHELKVLKLVAEKDGTCLMGLYHKLKSLRPQPHWKPSEEQVEALENVIKCELSAGMHIRAGILQTLQNDLEKL